MKDFIRQHLHKKQMNQTALAKRMNLDPAAICHMLNGNRHLKAIEVLELANILSVSPLEILNNLKRPK